MLRTNLVGVRRLTPTVPIPEHGLSEDVLCNDPRLGVRLSGDSLEVPVVRCLLVGNARSVNGPSDSCEVAHEV